MIKRIHFLHVNSKVECLLFYSLLLFDILFYFVTDFYPSLDGPAHLYNAYILKGLAESDSVFRQFYTVNPSPVPNWSGAVILSILETFFSGRIAEKLLLSIYTLAMAVSFRLLITRLNLNKAGIAVLVFPFIHSLLFHIGFFNFSLSFVFLFLIIWYWLKHQSETSFRHFFILFFLLTGCYFSAVLTFFFALVAIVSFSVIESVQSNGSVLNRKLIATLILIGVAALPGISMTLFFLFDTRFQEASVNKPFVELLMQLIDLRPLIIYDFSETKLLRPLGIILLLLLFRAIYHRFKGRERSASDFILIPMGLSLVLYFITPDDSAAGMMSDRYALIFFMLLIIWLAAKYYGQSLVWFSMLIIFAYLIPAKHRNLNIIPDLSREASALYQAGSYLEQGAFVLPVNYSDNWLQWHFSNYAGLHKPVVILENYETHLGWFPVNWKKPELPRIQLGNRDSLADIQWETNLNSLNIRKIDYVLLYGNPARLNDTTQAMLKGILASGYAEIARIDDFVSLYKLSQTPAIE